MITLEQALNSAYYRGHAIVRSDGTYTITSHPELKRLLVITKTGDDVAFTDESGNPLVFSALHKLDVYLEDRIPTLRAADLVNNGNIAAIWTAGKQWFLFTAARQDGTTIVSTSAYGRTRRDHQDDILKVKYVG